ncbi:hypothetical protein BU202_06590 [Streptococcus cuniculi]|uniref:DUF1310 family protein n=1 Tax=Streptococcus cuniculi TaxID=1432788 RepID=A0A1Q8E7D8_9STRE|nr:DUF1310 family protein [Streptococcus cuniculi]OLF47693.1 hypothetical protein BU202_06590 [Streptococcus cuniculi]
MKTWQKWLLGIIASVSVILGIVVLGQVSKQEQRKQEMLEFVQSREAKEAIEIVLKNRDPQALTSEGIIQKYEIDTDTVKYNPMGAVMVKVVVNGDGELFIDYIIYPNQDDISIATSSASEKLATLLREAYE